MTDTTPDELYAVYGQSVNQDTEPVTITHDMVERSYGCSYGCGNPYDYVLVNVMDAETLFLCTPCFVRTAIDMVQAITDPDDPDVAARLRLAGTVDQVPMHGSGTRRRGKNPPATTDDPDLISEFTALVTVEELPEEFR